MGLFSNNKKLCPICGNPTPRLLALKIEGTPICSKCHDKVDLPDGAINNLSMNEFREYIVYYEENQTLRDKFTETFSHNFSFLASVSLDTNNRLFRLSGMADGLVMEASNLKSFRILEGNKPLFEGTREAFRVYDTGIEDRVNALQPHISQYMLQKREEEFVDRIKREQADNQGKTYSPNRSYMTPVELPVPFRKYHIEFTLDHPYWQSRKWEIDGPRFDTNYPSIESYLDDYKQRTGELHALALNLMQILNPDAEEITVADIQTAAAQAVPVLNNGAAPGVNAVEEIKKYKELLDAGIITDEEFAAKKRQLLGI